MNFNDVIEIRDKLKQAGIEDSKVNSFITSYATRIGERQFILRTILLALISLERMLMAV